MRVILLLIISMLLAPARAASDYSGITTPQTEPKILIQINDKYNEVSLTLTEKSVVMEFSATLRNKINEDLTEQHEEDMQSFVDSGGEFIIGNPIILSSNELRYELDDIKHIHFNRGKLEFHYKNKSDLTFEDIQSTNGTTALSNFYVEDLERFVLTYNKFIEC